MIGSHGASGWPCKPDKSNRAAYIRTRRHAASIAPTRRRLDREAEIVVGGFSRRPLMRDDDSALDQAIREVAAILGDALVRLVFLNPALPQVDFAETETPRLQRRNRSIRRPCQVRRFLTTTNREYHISAGGTASGAPFKFRLKFRNRLPAGRGDARSVAPPSSGLGCWEIGARRRPASAPPRRSVRFERG